jgi:glycosyltransferase involved in cell wall biosynthesis
MSKKRILIYSTAYFPLVGGAEVAIKEIADRLYEYEFVMVTAKLDRKLPSVEKIGNVEVHRVGYGTKFDKIYLAIFGGSFGKKMHMKKSFDLVWAMMASFGGFAALSFKSKTKSAKSYQTSLQGEKMKDVPFLLTLQEGDPVEYILRKVRFIKKRFTEIFSEADGLQAISTYLFNWGKHMGFKGRVAEVIPNGVDVARFTREYPLEEIIKVRNSFGFSSDAVVLVTASRLVVKNGLSDVIKALVLLPPNVCFVICGTGELENSLKKLVEDLNLNSRVVFLGNKSHEELPKILKASDIFIRPSITEGLGNSFLEAMAAGLPTIGTMVGGIPDFLKDGENGFVCEPKNPRSIKNTVERIVKLTSHEKEIIHKNGLKIIQERFNWVSISNKMKVLLNILIS